MSTPNQFQSNYPFISCIKSNDVEYIGIIINFDDHVASIYDISVLKSDQEKNLFLEMGEVWWWESNRKIPINIFLKKEMNIFKYSIKSFNVKDVEVLFGPIINLGDISKKRIKRKSIQLVRNPKKTRS